MATVYYISTGKNSLGPYHSRFDAQTDIEAHEPFWGTDGAHVTIIEQDIPDEEDE